ncbi:MAG: hypothetical protein U0271_13470 [Polyangiaceae bacterium]
MSAALNATAPFQFDTGTPPLVVLTMRSPMVDADYAKMFVEWEAILSRRNTIVAITDARAIKDRGTPKQRAVIAEWTKRIEPLVRSYSRGHAVVVDNALVRGAMTAVSWLHKTPVPEAYFTRFDEAVDWCVLQLEKSNVAVPPSLRALGTKR